MTSVRTVTLSCDHDGCTATHRIEFKSEVQQRAVREQAQLAGWRRRDDEDFCPVHRPERAATQYAACPREGCGRTVPVREDGSLRRHRLIVGRGSYGIALGKTCVDPVTGDVHTRYPDLAVVERDNGEKESVGGDRDGQVLGLKEIAGLLSLHADDAGRVEHHQALHTLADGVLAIHREQEADCG